MFFSNAAAPAHSTLPLSFVPKKPFDGFKWKWASLQCTEGINDPVVLLGVLFRMRKLELSHKAIKYSSQAFADEMSSLSNDIKDKGIGVKLSTRVGERNLIRNSGQYWRALGLIPQDNHGGLVELTDFGRKVADHKISQAEFAAITIKTLTLPNPAIQKKEECEKWEEHGIKLTPLLLLLRIIRELNTQPHQGYLTKEELLQVVIPLSGTAGIKIADYVQFVLAKRQGTVDFSGWPDCHPSSNDHRIAREFLLFLSHYGYLERVDLPEEKFVYNELLDEEIGQIVQMADDGGLVSLVERLKESSVVGDIERKRVQSAVKRPNQARFRHDVLAAQPQCIITHVSIREVLEAAHIVPFKYHGEDTAANGFCMRMDMHQLFDAGHLRIDVDGRLFPSDRVRMDYGAFPSHIDIPAVVNREFIRWRWDNYNGM